MDKHPPNLQNLPRSSEAKAAALGIMYGMRGGGKSITVEEYRRRLNAVAMQNLPRHPLALVAVYRWKGFDERFGVHRYHCNNSTLSASHLGDELGTTGVRHSIMQTMTDSNNKSSTVCLIAWVKRHGTERMKEAVACAMMLGHETIVIVHAFGDE